jgi:hypothetical protein
MKILSMEDVCNRRRRRRQGRTQSAQLRHIQEYKCVSRGIKRRIKQRIKQEKKVGEKEG